MASGNGSDGCKRGHTAFNLNCLGKARQRQDQASIGDNQASVSWHL
jgi:hypothetical protein